MKIKMANETMVQNAEILRTLKEKGRLGYAIMRNLRKLEEASTEYRKIKEDAIRKHGVEQETKNGGTICSVPKENFSAFWDEIKDAATIEEEVDIFTVSENDFISGNLTSDKMDALIWMLEEDEDK